MQSDILIEMFEESAGYISTFEHFLEKSDNESVEQHNIAWKYEKRKRRKELGLPGNLTASKMPGVCELNQYWIMFFLPLKPSSSRNSFPDSVSWC